MTPERFYHRTSDECAAAILRDGFQDATGSYGFGSTVLTGVFISDEPVGIGEGVVEPEALLVVELADGLDEFEIIEELKGFREWCVPSAILNRGTVRLMSQDEEDAYWYARWSRADANGIDANGDANAVSTRPGG